jgi:sugar phosphate isomerase/epimerase
MDRREFLQAGFGAALAAQLTSDALNAQPAATPTAANKLRVAINSRHLQWLRTADEVAEAANEMGYAGVDLTVQPYPGHIDPAKAATDLPAFAKAIRKQGLEIAAMTCPIVDADSPGAEAILAAAQSVGITHYSWGTFRYDETKPVTAQLDALKPRVEKLAKLNEKYRMKAMYRPSAGSANVGAAVWDLLSVLRNFDPALVGFEFDSGEMTVAGGGGTWALNLRAAGPYIGGVLLKDLVLESTFVVKGGGPFTGQPAAAGGRGGGPGGFGGPPGASGAGGRGGGRGGSPGGVRGAVSAPPWHDRPVPLGTGMVGLSLMSGILKEINFSGPVEVQAEYPNGGAETGEDHLSLPRELVIGAMKRDLLSVRAAWAASNLL